MSSRYKQGLVWRVNLVSFPTVYSVLSETTVLCECECECECECVASYIILLCHIWACRMLHIHIHIHIHIHTAPRTGPMAQLI